MKRIVLLIVCYIVVLAFGTVRQCDDVTCPVGRFCAVNDDFEAVCVCNANCTDSNPLVCESDKGEYSNYCALKLVGCETNTNVWVASNTQCRDVGSKCSGFVCPSNRECAVADNQAICVCIQSCPSPSFPDPVCGSDNQTYITECDLHRHSCLTNKDITIAYTGECKRASVCDGFSCPQGQRCTVNERSQPVCVCLDIFECSFKTDIVCGSDGRTYVNECELYKEACTSTTLITVAYKGYCFEGTVCEGNRCPANRECSVDANNQPVCVCVPQCPNDNDPVCGSDGITYQNLCEFNRLACLSHSNVTVKRTGPCIYEEHCDGVVCPHPMTCVVDENNQTSCGCNNRCDETYYPVCGSDKKTHINYCQMKVAACQTNTIITDLYYGVCSEGPNCGGSNCPTRTHCDSEHQPEPKCVCDTDCPTSYTPVCGSNNKTYNNKCELQRDVCLTNIPISVQFSRRCEEGPGCDFLQCPNDLVCAVDDRNRPICVCSQYCYPTTAEVCGTDGKTYSNDCFLNVAACMTNKTIKLQSREQCNAVDPCKGVICSLDRFCAVDDKGQPICVCNEDCAWPGSIVCGSDRQTYVNLCKLRRQSCLSNTNIRWHHYGRCDEASVCDEVSCPMGRRCAVDGENRPICVCIDQCLNVQYPICGIDGRTYNNERDLQKDACLTGKNITLIYRGQSDQGLTCSDINCPWNDRKCALNEKNQPTCVCKSNCDSLFNYPRCGTDGKTYSSDCHLQVEACTTNSNIRVASVGPCNQDSNPHND